MYARSLLYIRLTSEIIETDVCIVHSEGVQEIQYCFSHHRWTAALALRLGTIRDCLAHGISRLALRFPPPGALR